METEIFKPIKGYEDYYEVSNLGRVKSLARVWSVGIKDDTILKSGWNKTGYLNVTLCVDKVKKVCLIHRLVAAHFCEKKEGCNVVNHKNSDRSDNRAENLEWVTTQENVIHSYKFGNKEGVRGEKNHLAKHTAEEVFKIRELYATKQYNQYQLADMFKCKQPQISRIISKQRWNHLI